MSTTNTYGNPAGTVGTLNGFFKETYSEKLKELIPDNVLLLNMIKFLSKDKQPGNLFHTPIILGLEHGITFGDPDADAFNLEAPVSGSVKDAQVKGSPAILRSMIGYTAIARAAQGGQKAFMDATKFVVANMLRSFSKKLEIEMLYGQTGYATFADTDVSGAVLTVPVAEWAPGIWAGAENMPIDIYKSDGTFMGNFVVSKVNMSTRAITFDAAPVLATGSYTVYHKAAYGKEFAGIHKILSTTSGNLFNIDVSKYALFQGNTYSAASGALSFTKLQLAAARAVEKGHEGKLTAIVNPRGWANMLSDQAALRKYDSSYSESTMKNGSKALTFYSQNGEIEIIPSIYVKEGHSFLLSMEDWNRVGSTDLTFKLPGQNEEFMRHMENASALELRIFTDQALFCSAPGRNVVITSIVNNT